MESLASWSRFVSRRTKAVPLKFVGGLRHSLKRGLCAPPHSHTTIEIVYHPTGKGVTRVGKDRAVSFDQGGVVIYAPHEVHDQTMETGGDDFCVWIAVPDQRHVPKKCFHVPAVSDATITEDLRFLSQGRVHLNAMEQTIFDLRATSTLYALIHLACTRRTEDRGGSTHQHILKAGQYIRDHFATIKTLQVVSDHLGISYDHLRHEFKKQSGKSPVRYLIEVRIERAKTLLMHSRLPLKQVATMCGFADEYYFSAAFRSSTGHPPGRYRTRQSN